MERLVIEEWEWEWGWEWEWEWEWEAAETLRVLDSCFYANHKT